MTERKMMSINAAARHFGVSAPYAHKILTREGLVGEPGFVGVHSAILFDAEAVKAIDFKRSRPKRATNRSRYRREQLTQRVFECARAGLTYHETINKVGGDAEEVLRLYAIATDPEQALAEAKERDEQLEHEHRLTKQRAEHTKKIRAVLMGEKK